MRGQAGSCGILDPSQPPLVQSGEPLWSGRAPQAGPAKVPLRGGGGGHKVHGAGACRAWREQEPLHAGLRVQSSSSRALPEQVKERGSTRLFTSFST